MADPIQPTVESLQSEIAQMRANHVAEVNSLRQEAAGYRVSRNDALRRGKVLDTVLGKHNIKFSMEDADVSKLEIVNGAVVGDFDYTPRAVAPAPPPNAAAGDTGLTMDKVKTMSAAEIEADWDNVQTVMAESRNSGV